MRIMVASLSLSALAFLSPTSSIASECSGNPDALGVFRILEIDTTGGPRYGTLQYEQTLDLGPNEVVLTFDDGPHPHNTTRVMKALNKECVKATFFPVGTMTERHPEILQAMADAGHTIGAHTWSHRNISRLSFAKATSQIERGFHVVNASVDIPIAPFFRYPGLNDSDPMNDYAVQRGLAIFSTDVSSDDWRGIGPSTIIRRTMMRLRRHEMGMILLHDTKYATAAAVPGLLRALKKGGYKVVHIVPKQNYVSLESADAGALKPEVATVAKVDTGHDAN